jgi:enoyl-CoA hydratase/carnithine racemase
VEPVACRVESGVAWIEFGDPAVRNVLAVPLLEALPRAIADALQHDARVVVLRGRGDLWSAGYDVGEIPPDLFAADPRATLAHPYERCMRDVAACPVPTLAAVNGHAFGGGVELAVSCDLRLLRAGSRMGIPAARLGLVYPHAGIATLLRLLGPAPTRYLLYTGEPVDDAHAERIGLVDRVVPAAEFDAAVTALATRIAAGAPLAVRGMKRILTTLERGTALTDADVQGMLELRQASYQSADFREGRAAFASKREPRFEGR